MCTVHYTLYSERCILYSVHLPFIHYTLYNVVAKPYVPYTKHIGGFRSAMFYRVSRYIQYTRFIYLTPNTIHNTLCTVYNIYSVQCSLYTVQCILCSFIVDNTHEHVNSGRVTQSSHLTLTIHYSCFG